MSFDINAKINKLKSEINTNEENLKSFESANYDGHEDRNVQRIKIEIEKLKKELLKWETTKRMASTKDTAEILRLSGFTVDEEVSPKFKKVMSEFGKGELKSSSGEKVTNPKQAKAIAYSEAGETKDSKFEVMYTIGHFHDPETLKDKKEIIQANSAGEAHRMIENKWKGNLNRIIQITQVHDSDCGKVFTKGTEDGGPGSGIKGHTTPEERKSSSFKMQQEAKMNQKIREDIEDFFDHDGELEDDDEFYTAMKKKYGYSKEEIKKYEESFENYRDKIINGDDDATKGGSIKKYGEKNSQKMEDAEEQWITMNGAHVKIEEGQSKGEAVKKFTSSKKKEPKSEGEILKENPEKMHPLYRAYYETHPEKKESPKEKSKKKFKYYPDSDEEEKKRIDIANEFPKGSYVKSAGGRIFKITHNDPYENELWMKVVAGKQKGKEGLFEYSALKESGVTKVTEEEALGKKSNSKDSAIHKECHEILKLSGFIN